MLTYVKWDAGLSFSADYSVPLSIVVDRGTKERRFERTIVRAVTDFPLPFTALNFHIRL